MHIVYSYANLLTLNPIYFINIFPYLLYFLFTATFLLLLMIYWCLVKIFEVFVIFNQKSITLLSSCCEMTFLFLHHLFCTDYQVILTV